MTTATLDRAAPEALARGAPVLAPAILVVAAPGVARTGYLLRHVCAELEGGHSVLLVDFGGIEGDLLAALLRSGRSVLAEADARDAVLPLDSLRALPAESREAAGNLLAAWLRPPGHLAESHEARAVVELVARLPVLLPRVGLYAWRRYLIDRGFRRECVRGLRREGVDPSPLSLARPGTVLWKMLSDCVERVLGHDDILDRVFPVAENGRLGEPAASPELRIVRMEAPRSARHGRYPALLWLHLVAALAGRPGRRHDGRSHLGRLVLVDPPQPVCGMPDLLAGALRGDRSLRVTVVTAERRSNGPPEAWFGRAPAVVVQRSLGPEQLASWGYLEDRDAQRLHAREAGAALLFVHQRGAPVERWCTLEVPRSLPGAMPGALVVARAEGRRRYLIERAAVVENRRRIESHAERVSRRAVSQDLLERALRMERLTSAWRRAFRNKGDPGVDGITVEAFAERWQQHLAALQADAREGRYRPQAYRVVWQKKASGGERPLSVPTVLDRVLMGAAAGVLSPVLEPYFSDRSFAYRPGRGAKGAVLEILASQRLTEGWAIVADIASYFETIDHRLLLAMLREHVADDAFVQLVAAWISNPALDGGRETRPRRGVPQGAPISPVLSNLCLTPLDRWMERRGLDYARYADDFVALCDSAAQAQQAATDLEAFLARELKLSVKPTKTIFVPVAEGFQFLGFYLGPWGATIPDERLGEALQEVANILGSEAGGLETLGRLDAYVRGFRNYFDLGTPLTSEALATLEADRLRQLGAWASARRLDLSLVLARSERFVVEVAPAPVPGAYGQESREPPDDELLSLVPPSLGPPSGPPTSLATVDRRPAAVRARAAGPRAAAVNAGGHLGIFGHGAVASLAEDRLVLHRKRELVFEVPIAALRTIQVDSYGMTLTTPLLERLAEEDVPVLFAHHGGQPWAVLRPLTARGSADLLKAQIAAQAGPLAIAVARELVSAKLANQERLLRYYAKYRARRTAPSGARLREAADQIAKRRAELTSIEPADRDAARRRLFSIEGRGGALYWSALAELLGEAFPGRRGRGATDPVNVALNYGYGILYAAAWGAAGRAGLEPGIGMLHASPGDRGALIFDLVEPFRVPAVDRPVIGLLSRGKVVKLNTDGHLTANSRRHVAGVVGRAFDRETPWGGARRSLAEHIARHAQALAVWLQGGEPLQALRIRW